MGVVIKRQVWLECIDVVSGYCCKELKVGLRQIFRNNI